MGEGRVVEIVDARSLRLEDGREVRLAGIEPAAATRQALTAMLLGREVSLRGRDDAPDRYGRQPALVFPQSRDIPAQVLLLAEGQALVSFLTTVKDCAAALLAA